MVGVISVGVGWFLLLVAGAVYVSRREAIGLARAVGALSLTPLDRLEEGALCAVSGEVVSRRPVRDPIGEELVAHYELEVERVPEPLVRTEGNRVRLEREGARVSVQLRGADLRVREQDRLDEIWPEARRRELLERLEPEDSHDSREDARVAGAGSGAGGRVRLRRLALNQTVTVVGVPVTSKEGLELSPAAGVLFVTPGSLEELQAELREDTVGLDRMMRICAVVGAVAIAIGVASFLLL